MAFAICNIRSIHRFSWRGAIIFSLTMITIHAACAYSQYFRIRGRNRIEYSGNQLGSVRLSRTEPSRIGSIEKSIESNRTEPRLIEDRIWPNRILCSNSRTE
jgi:hypothetical protein